MLLIALFAFGAIFFLALPGFLLWVYFKTFNKQAIILSEVGEDENDAIVKYVKCKTVEMPNVGQVIRFHPFSGLKPCKQFDSKYWTTVKLKSRLLEGITLYRQGMNYRPVVGRISKDGTYALEIQDENNTKFRIAYEIAESKRKRDGGTTTPTVIAFFVFMIFIVFAFVTGVIYIMDENTKTYFVSQGLTIVAG